MFRCIFVSGRKSVFPIIRNKLKRDKEIKQDLQPRYSVRYPPNRGAIIGVIPTNTLR